MTHDYTALDPQEGPTIWVKQSDANKFNLIIAVGTYPTETEVTFVLTHDETRRLYEFVENQ